MNKNFIVTIILIIFIGLTAIYLIADSKNEINKNINNLYNRIDSVKVAINHIDSLSRSLVKISSNHDSIINKVDDNVKQLSLKRYKQQNNFNQERDSLNILIKNYYIELNKLSKNLNNINIK